MRKNKLIAGILSLAMTASLMPIQAMAKQAPAGFYDHNFETGIVPKSARFRLNSTFSVATHIDNNTGTGSKLAPADWSYEVVDETESNKALKFTFDSEGGTKTLSDNGKTVGGLIIADLPGNLYDASKPNNYTYKKWCEYSFSYKIDKPLNMDAGHFMTIADKHGNSIIRMKYKNNKIVVGTADIDISSFDPIFGKWVNVKWDIRNYPATAGQAVRITRDYVDDNGETVTETLFEDIGKYNTTMEMIALQVSSAGMTDGASFMIDNIYAAYLENKDLTKVTFDAKGGSAVDPVQTAIGKINLSWAGTPVKEGATFAGWYRDETLTEPFDGTGVEENITVYAKYNENRKVTFETNDLEITVDPMYTGTGSIELPDISKEGYALSWWKDAEFTQEFDGTGITEDITVYAKWEKLHTVTFDTNGGNTIDPVQTTGIIDFTDINPVKGQYVFAGWYLDKQCQNSFDTASAVTADTTLYAKWNSMIYSESFDSESYNEGFDVIKTDFYKNEVTADETRNNVMRYTFIGDKNAWASNTTAFEFKLPLEFKNDGSTYEIGYRFKPGKGTRFVPYLHVIGKYERNRLFDIQTNSGAPVCWGTEYTEDTFINDEIEGYVSVKAILNRKDKKARVFVSGRKVSGEEFNLSYSVEDMGRCIEVLQDIAITAGPYYAPATNATLDIDDIYVRLADKHKVTFKYNDGVTADETVDTDMYGSVTLPVPTRENYEFIGWYKDADCTSEFDGIGITEDITVYALWQTNPTVSAITPENGAEGVDSQPTVKIYFDSKMDLNSINKSNIKIYKGDTALDEQYYTVNASHNVNGKTEAVITFAHRLDLKGEYTVKVLTGVKNLCYNMAEDFTSSFTVTGLALNARVISVKDSDGNNVESLKENAGKTIKINIELKNNTADALTCTPIIGVHSGSTLKSCGIMQAQTIEESSTPEFELKLPQDAEDGDTVSMFTVDGLRTIKPLALKLNIK